MYLRSKKLQRLSINLFPKAKVDSIALLGEKLQSL